MSDKQGSAPQGRINDANDAVGTCAFIPVVLDKPGIEAIYEGLRLAKIPGFPPRKGS